MTHDFDQRLDRRHSDSGKWHRYDEDVLPMWVADMDFRSPEPVVRALQERVEHGVFGYGMVPPELPEVIVTRLRRLHGWEVSPEALLFLPGVVVGFNLVWHAVTSPGDGVLLQTPIYFPMLRAPDNAGLVNNEMRLSRQPDGRYVIDFDAFEGAITDRTRLFTLCNPHNPVGRVYERDELETMAEVCLRHDLIVCSDEIHCDLVFRPHDHIPIASLGPEIADRTVTLIAPSKTFNIPGLKCSVAIATNPGLRERLTAARQGLVGGINVMGYIAALAAYRDGHAWLTDVLSYLEGNLDSLINYVESRLPGITMHRPEGTFLAWLDCRDAGIPGNPQEFFLDRARVAMNDGATFGRGGKGFVRLNFACPRSTLTEALDRMREALLGLDQTCGQHSQ